MYLFLKKKGTPETLLTRFFIFRNVMQLVQKAKKNFFSLTVIVMNDLKIFDRCLGDSAMEVEHI